MRKTIRILLSAAAGISILIFFAGCGGNDSDTGNADNTSSRITQANQNFAGNWALRTDLSTAVDPWRTIRLDIDVDGSVIDIEKTVTTGRRSTTENYRMDTANEENFVPMAVWLDNRHIGAYLPHNSGKTIRADWLDNGQTLKMESSYTLETHQGETPVRAYVEYRLSRGGDRLTMLEIRSSRNRPILHVYERQQ